jgi:hypothetical protein
MDFTSLPGAKMALYEFGDWLGIRNNAQPALLFVKEFNAINVC